MNWDKAPEGTTHKYVGLWLKKDVTGWHQYMTGWQFLSNDGARIVMNALSEGKVAVRPPAIDWTYAPKSATHTDGTNWFKKWSTGWVMWSGALWDDVANINGTLTERPGAPVHGNPAHHDDATHVHDKTGIFYKRDPDKMYRWSVKNLKWVPLLEAFTTAMFKSGVLQPVSTWTEQADAHNPVILKCEHDETVKVVPMGAMTDKAKHTYQDYKDAGWTADALIDWGLMHRPGVHRKANVGIVSAKAPMEALPHTPDWDNAPRGARWFDPQHDNWLKRSAGDCLSVWSKATKWTDCSTWSDNYPKDRWIDHPKKRIKVIDMAQPHTEKTVHIPNWDDQPPGVQWFDPSDGAWLRRNINGYLDQWDGVWKQISLWRDKYPLADWHTEPGNKSAFADCTLVEIGGDKPTKYTGGVTLKPVTVPVAMLNKAAAAIGDRASERDQESERSMATCVAAFNAMYGKDLTETEGWMFMTVLKMSRAKQGSYQEDDYVDMAAYCALAGESAS